MNFNNKEKWIYLKIKKLNEITYKLFFDEIKIFIFFKIILKFHFIHNKILNILFN